MDDGEFDISNDVINVKKVFFYKTEEKTKNTEDLYLTCFDDGSENVGYVYYWDDECRESKYLFEIEKTNQDRLSYHRGKCYN